MLPARPTLSEQILDAAQDGIICLDVEARIEYANPAAARMLGCSVVDELHGQPIRTYIQFLGFTPGSHASPEVLTLGSMSLLAHGEQTCWSEAGNSFPIEYESAPMRANGSLTGAVVTFRDIGQRRAIERQKDEQISVVSHELRTPLTSMRSALGLLVSGQLKESPATGQRLLDIAVRNTDRLIRLINDILDLERLDSGQGSMASVSCNAGELMTHAADGVRSLAEQLGVLLEVEPSAAHVLGDPDRLMQVMTNLLANAIKFSPSAGGSVWISAAQGAHELVFRVRDEGRGIPPDKLETIFERFVQIDEGESSKKGGSGLGLAISREIVKQHGGHIWAESTVGAGTTVCVALPCAETSIARLVPGRARKGSDADAAAA